MNIQSRIQLSHNKMRAMGSLSRGVTALNHAPLSLLKFKKWFLFCGRDDGTVLSKASPLLAEMRPRLSCILLL